MNVGFRGTPHSFHGPFSDFARGGIECHTYERECPAIAGVLLVVVAQFDLRESFLGSFVELELKNVDMRIGQYHRIHAPAACVFLHAYPVSQ